MAEAMISTPLLHETDFSHDAVARLLHAAGLPTELDWSPVSGGANNRVYCANTVNEKVLLKLYFQSEGDGRDRLRGEHCFYGLAEKNGLDSVPRVLGWDIEQRLAIFEFIEGRKLDAAEVTADHVRAAARFVASTNEALDEIVSFKDEPIASEASFSFDQHLATVQARVDKLKSLPVHDDLDADALSWINQELAPAWLRVRHKAAALASELPLGGANVLSESQRWISPSDFGFHNALLEDNRVLKFFDFEYAGWDDPAKLVADFFCQPAVPVPLALWDEFIGGLSACSRWQPEAAHRARLLLPVYRIKWCCIMMNEFLAQEARRRYFSSPKMEDRRVLQFSKARASLEHLVSSK